jgi:hypothetical protein
MYTLFFTAKMLISQPTREALHAWTTAPLPGYLKILWPHVGTIYLMNIFTRTTGHSSWASSSSRSSDTEPLHWHVPTYILSPVPARMSPNSSERCTPISQSTGPSICTNLFDSTLTSATNPGKWPINSSNSLVKLSKPPRKHV